MKRISPEELSAWMEREEQPLLLDVRQPHEHALAALPGSRLIPLPELAERHREILGWQQRDIVVYCHHGWRSQRAIHLLEAMGFERLWNLESGIDGWSGRVDPSLARY